MSTRSIDLGIAFAEAADRVQEDRYIVRGESVDLAIDACSCSREACWHVVAATVHQARTNARTTA